MKRKTYLYTGPQSGVSLKEAGDILLYPGQPVDLPEDHNYTRRLIKRGWLKETPAPSAPLKSTARKVKEAADGLT